MENRGFKGVDDYRNCTSPRWKTQQDRNTIRQTGSPADEDYGKTKYGGGKRAGEELQHQIYTS